MIRLTSLLALTLAMLCGYSNCAGPQTLADSREFSDVQSCSQVVIDEYLSDLVNEPGGPDDATAEILRDDIEAKYSCLIPDGVNS